MLMTEHLGNYILNGRHMTALSCLEGGFCLGLKVKY